MAKRDRVIKALAVGDNHIDNRNPTSRCDNYMEACLAELEECLLIAQEREVDYIGFLGDIFHRREPDGECRNRVMECLKKNDRRKFVAVGNHDTGHHLQNLPKSALGSLIVAGLIEYTDFCKEFSLGFAHFSATVHKDISSGLMTGHPAVVWMAHASIVLSPFHEDYVLLEEAPLNPECKLLLCGHIHGPISRRRGDGVEFINPGSIGRPAASKENMGRRPGPLYYEYTLGGELVKTEQIPLRSAKPAEEVFRMDQIAGSKITKTKAREFMKQVMQVSTMPHGEDKYTRIIRSGKEKQIDDAVLKLALATMREVNEHQEVINE